MGGEPACRSWQQPDAYPCADQAANGREFVTLAGDRERYPGAREHRIDERPLPITGPRRDERLSGKVCHGDFLLTGKPVQRRNGEKDFFPEQLYRTK